MWGEKAFELMKELERSQDCIPPYDDDAVRVIREEILVMNEFVENAMQIYNPDTNVFLAATRLREAAIARNKRCLLAYQWNRLQRIRQMRWEFGSILPIEIKSNLSESEIKWFTKYSKSLANYMKTIGANHGLNLVQDVKPPKTLYLEVRSMSDYGKLELDDGEVIVLKKNSQHLIPRSQSEPLIRQGILEQIKH